MFEAPNWAVGANIAPVVNYYAPYSSEVTDETIMLFGPHKGVKMRDVPFIYLRKYKDAPTNVKNYYLIEYIKSK